MIVFAEHTLKQKTPYLLLLIMTMFYSFFSPPLRFICNLTHQMECFTNSWGLFRMPIWE